ncbi:MAG: hypothetical protein P8H61_10055, partial [Ilumatobacter sp.]|nr:hypothetical protein [Ilumatobacter sp.]
WGTFLSVSAADAEDRSMSTLTLVDVGVKYSRRSASALTGHFDTVVSGEWLGLIGPNGAGK